MSFFKEYFTFSKKERSGIISLFVLMIISISIYILTESFPVSRKYNYSEFKEEIDRFENQRTMAMKTEKAESERKYSAKKNKSYPSFTFDPNTITKDSLELLGIYPKLSDRIIKYRNAGGKFKTPEDLLKIYGFPQKVYDRIAGLVIFKNTGELKESKSEKKEPESYSKRLVNLNTADTTELKSLKGIGSKLSARIIKFRDNAGGFYSIDQLMDVYGVKPETFEMIKSQITVDDKVEKININSITAEGLKNHPYINKWNIANAIVNYRSKHGNYKQAADLMKTDLVSEDLCRKIAPYLIFE